jgi:hypothetical protein
VVLFFRGVGAPKAVYDPYARSAGGIAPVTLLLNSNKQLRHWRFDSMLSIEPFHSL